MKKLLCLALPLMLAACGGNAQSYLAGKGLSAIAPESFPNCRGYNCKSVDTVALSPQDWKEIRALFKKADSAEEERRAIAKSIGVLEQKTGAQTGSTEDVGGTYVKLGLYQQDCVDESTNTTIYLTLLQQQDMLRFHDVGAPVTRLPFYAGHFGPHRTAVITERDSGARFAVDSWFHDNGHAAEIVPLGRWFNGWSP